MAEHSGEDHPLGTPVFHTGMLPADGNLPGDSVALPSAVQTVLPMAKCRKAEGFCKCWQAGRDPLSPCLEPVSPVPHWPKPPTL